MSSAEFRVSTSSALVTAATRVLSSGLALAAVATGAVAMPLKEPSPVVGMAEQPGPNVSAPASSAIGSLFGTPRRGSEALVSSRGGLGVGVAAAGGRPSDIVSARAARPLARLREERFMVCDLP